MVVWEITKNSHVNQRWKAAEKLAKNHHVKVYHIRYDHKSQTTALHYVVVGKTTEYLVIFDQKAPNVWWCQCKDFSINVILRKKRNYCKHVLAVKIALENNTADHYYLTEKEYKALRPNLFFHQED